MFYSIIIYPCVGKKLTSVIDDGSDDGGSDDLNLCLVSKQVAVHQLPPVLILHLKRFTIEPDGIFKDTQHIKFPHKLNMAPYCTTQCVKVCYQLYMYLLISLSLYYCFYCFP